jgi:hypothetical protein
MEMTMQLKAKAVLLTTLAVAGCGGSSSEGEPRRSYTKIAWDGSELPDIAEQWSCVRDNQTSLIWEHKPDDYSLRSTSWDYSWFDSSQLPSEQGYPDNGDNCYFTDRCDTEKYIVDVNVTSLCGSTDWRLPKQIELESLLWRVKYINGTFNPEKYPAPIDNIYFPNTPIGYYWTSEKSADTATIVSFGVNANIFGLAKRSPSGKIRAVRGEMIVDEVTITVSAINGGEISITTPAGNSVCSGTCDIDANVGQEITLTAQPVYPYAFVEWQDCPSTLDNVCTIAVTSPLEVQAVFQSIIP